VNGIRFSSRRSSCSASQQERDTKSSNAKNSRETLHGFANDCPRRSNRQRAIRATTSNVFRVGVAHEHEVHCAARRSGRCARIRRDNRRREFLRREFDDECSFAVNHGVASSRLRNTTRGCGISDATAVCRGRTKTFAVGYSRHGEQHCGGEKVQVRHLRRNQRPETTCPDCTRRLRAAMHRKTSACRRLRRGNRKTSRSNFRGKSLDWREGGFARGGRSLTSACDIMHRTRVTPNVKVAMCNELVQQQCSESGAFRCGVVRYPIKQHFEPRRSAHAASEKSKADATWFGFLAALCCSPHGNSGLMLHCPQCN